MRRFVQLDNDIVTGWLQSASAPDFELPAGRTFVEVIAFPPMGSQWSGGIFIPPPAPPDHGFRVGVREFFLRFTRTERTGIRAAAVTDNVVADWIDLVKAEGTILLRHPDTLDGFQMLVNKGLLTLARANAIING
jgi:hypothetical protein